MNSRNISGWVKINGFCILWKKESILFCNFDSTYTLTLMISLKKLREINKYLLLLLNLEVSFSMQPIWQFWAAVRFHGIFTHHWRKQDKHIWFHVIFQIVLVLTWRKAAHMYVNCYFLTEKRLKMGVFWRKTAWYLTIEL